MKRGKAVFGRAGLLIQISWIRFWNGRISLKKRLSRKRKEHRLPKPSCQLVGGRVGLVVLITWWASPATRFLRGVEIC